MPLGSFRMSGGIGRKSPIASAVSAIGGDISYYYDSTKLYKTHRFTNSGTFTVSSGGTIEALLVGAGGGGGGTVSGYNAHGGGGGGQVKSLTTVSVTPQAYTITVGTGGARGTGSSPAKGATGGSTSAFGQTASGGQGGEGDAYSTGAGGTSGAGFSGGSGNWDGSTSNYAGGGGGGAGGAGGSASSYNGFYGIGGNGGIGVASSITGVSTYYGGGARGYANYSNPPQWGPGTNGLGQENAGGGGDREAGKNGAVFIRYETPMYYNLGSPVYIGSSVSTTAQDDAPSGLYISPNGLNLYILGSDTDRVYQYSLSTAWDVTNITYITSFSISSQTTIPSGITFKPDGTKFYICGIQNASGYLYEYNLSTPWNLSSASYSGTKSVSAQDSDMQGISFDPTGTKMFLVGNSNDAVYQYSLSTAWNITTASYVKTLSVASQTLNPNSGLSISLDLAFSIDGKKMFVITNNPAIVIQWNLTTAWDIATASYSTQFNTVINSLSFASGMYFNPDGSRLYKISTNGDKIDFWNIQG